MPKDIKIKEKDSHYIRKLDRRIAFTSRVKRNVSNQYDKLKKEMDDYNLISIYALESNFLNNEYETDLVEVAEYHYDFDETSDKIYDELLKDTLDNRFVYLERNTRHKILLSNSVVGSLLRIDNYLDNLGKKIKDKYEEIATLENRIEAINNENRNMVDLSSRLGELVVKLKRIEEELNNG